MRSLSRDTILKLVLLCVGTLAVVTAHTLIGRLWQPTRAMAPLKVRLHGTLPSHNATEFT